MLKLDLSKLATFLPQDLRSFAPSLPYFCSSIPLKIRKATAGSVVVPDLEITLTEKSRSPMAAISSSRASVDRPLPAK